jgi:TatD DNase family protein
MVHCYSEGPAEVPLWTALGFHVSFAGTVTYPDAKALRAAAAVVPAERVLTETDAPYLAPQHVRGRRNEPLYVAATYAVLAHEREMDLGLLIEAVATNARQLFGPRWGT